MNDRDHVALIDTLLIEVMHHSNVVEHTLQAQQREGRQGVSDAPGTAFHPEPST